MGAIFLSVGKGAFCLTAPFLMGTQPKVTSVPPLVWKRGTVIAYRGQRRLQGRKKQTNSHSPPQKQWFLCSLFHIRACLNLLSPSITAEPTAAPVKFPGTPQPYTAIPSWGCLFVPFLSAGNTEWSLGGPGRLCCQIAPVGCSAQHFNF